MSNNVVREITYLGLTKKFTNEFDLLSETEYNDIVAKWYEKACPWLYAKRMNKENLTKMQYLTNLFDFI